MDNQNKPKTKTAHIFVPAHHGTALIFVEYRGKRLHTETAIDDARGDVANRNFRQAIERAEKWAKSNGFTNVKID